MTSQHYCSTDDTTAAEQQRLGELRQRDSAADRPATDEHLTAGRVTSIQLSAPNPSNSALGTRPTARPTVYVEHNQRRTSNTADGVLRICPTGHVELDHTCASNTAAQEPKNARSSPPKWTQVRPRTTCGVRATHVQERIWVRYRSLEWRPSPGRPARHLCPTPHRTTRHGGQTLPPGSPPAG